MKKIMLKLALCLAITPVSLPSLQAAEIIKVDILKEQQALANLKVVKAPVAGDERYPISEAFALKPLKSLVTKIKTDPTYIPTKEERYAVYVCQLVFDQIKNDPANALNGTRVKENHHLTFEGGTSPFLRANITVYLSEVALAFDHLQKIFMAPAPSPAPTPAPLPAPLTVEKLLQEQNDLLQLKVVSSAPKTNERFPISENYIVKPVLSLINKMSKNEDYVPTAEERKALYTCSMVFAKIDQNPHENIIKGSNLAENPHFIYIKKNADSFLRANVEVSASLVQWAVEETKKRVTKIQTHNQEIDWGNWCQTITGKVNAFFSLPYKDGHLFAGCKKKSATIQGKNYDVERPNHALAHGLRSAFIASDIIDAYADSDAMSFHTENTQNFAKLVQAYVASDPDFRKKVFMASAYQRTGRQSEISGKESEFAKKQYNSYVQKDAENFHEAVMNTPEIKQLFTGPDEVKAYSLAIFPNQEEKDGLSQNLQQLNTVVRAAIFTSHMVDLKRIANTGNHSFPLNGVKGSVAINIGANVLVNKNDSDDWADWTFNDMAKFPAETALLNKIWNREEAYLEATGDRSLKAPYYENKFFLQAQDPQLMANILLDTQKELNKKA